MQRAARLLAEQLGRQSPSQQQRFLVAASAGGSQQHQHSSNSPHTALLAASAALFSAAGGLFVALGQPEGPAQCEQQQASSGQTVKQKPALPMYSADEVAKHDNPQDRIWVTHKDGVYDITDFVNSHPGGPQRIMLAAGGSVDSFWSMYQQHQQQQVLSMLEEMRIGTLEGGQPEQQVADPYANEPKRHRALIVRSNKPFNAESPAEVLLAPKTPSDLFYVRNHLPVPHIDAVDWKLRVEGEGLRKLELSLADLQTQFKKHTVTATLQCSGNRRAEIHKIKPIKGLFWDAGAIGTATFGGVLLRDVLKSAGLDEDDTEAQHVCFEGLDAEPGGACYGASIPLDKAINRSGDVLLAYEMNGRSLPPDHGFPLRVVVPGVTGARSVKWLHRIIASREESGSHWQQKDYKSFSPNVDWDTVDWSSAPAIQETNVQSAILSPSPSQVLEGPLDEVEVKGWAFSGGGHAIIRVDVSADGGQTWTTAELHPAAGKAGQLHRQWAWTLWEATVPVKGTGKVELCCRATDSSYNTQPQTYESTWNLRGVVNNAWHRVAIEAQ